MALLNRVLLVIPAYNEELRLAVPLRAYVAEARSRPGLDVHFLLVLNGCRDRTRDVAKSLCREFPEVNFIEYRQPVGKGGAVVAGLRQGTAYDWAGFADADGATTPPTLFALLDAGKGSDAVIGTRDMSTRPFGRRITSASFNFIVRCLFNLPHRDTQCGAKFFRGSVLSDLLPSLTLADMAFDIDMLLCLRRKGYSVAEAKVDWNEQAGSTVKFLRTPILMFLSVLRLRVGCDRGQGARRLVVAMIEGCYRQVAGVARPALPGASEVSCR